MPKSNSFTDTIISHSYVMIRKRQQRKICILIFILQNISRQMLDCKQYNLEFARTEKKNIIYIILLSESYVT